MFTFLNFCQVPFQATINKIKILSTCEQPYKAFTKFYNFRGKFTQREKKST